MKTSVALVSVIVAVASAASAQAPAPNPPNQKQNPFGVVTPGLTAGQPAATVMIVPVSACPVSIQAKQRGVTQLVKTGKNEAPSQRDFMPEPAQHIHLILKGFAKNKRVMSAEITVRGRSARPRIDNTQSLFSDQPSDLRRTLDVAFTDEGDGSVSADLDLPAFTAVTSLQLQWITYADGSSWDRGNHKMCTVAPDPVMLIAGR